MKKTYIAFILAAICIVCCGCNSSNGETNVLESKAEDVTSDILDDVDATNNNTSTEQSAVISTENITETLCEHSYGEWNEATEPTCTVEGKSERFCEKCNEKEEMTIDKTEHIYGEWKAVTLSTCSVEGKTERVCKNCNNVETKGMDKLQHTLATDAAVPATCSNYGLSEGKHCSVCKAIVVKQITTAKLSHKYSDGKCSVCNADDPSFVSFQKSFKAVSNYLEEYGYGGEYTKTVNGGTLYFIHTKQDTIVIRFDSNCNKSEYSSFNTLNSGIRIYNDGTIEVFSVVWTKYGVIQSNKWFNVKKHFKASEITKGTSIRYNDDTIPKVYQQAVDEFTTEALHLVIKEGNNYFAKAGVNMYSLGFVNY